MKQEKNWNNQYKDIVLQVHLYQFFFDPLCFFSWSFFSLLEIIF